MSPLSLSSFPSTYTFSEFVSLYILLSPSHCVCLLPFWQIFCFCSALPKIITNGYKALNLEHFFTCGHDEVRAWTIMVFIAIIKCHCWFGTIIVIFILQLILNESERYSSCCCLGNFVIHHKYQFDNVLLSCGKSG